MLAYGKGDLVLSLGLGSNSFIGDRRTMYGWGHNYGFIKGVDHLGLNTVGPLTKIVRSNIWGNNVLLQVPRDSAKPTKKGLRAWIDHMELNYDMFLVTPKKIVKLLIFNKIK
jgi:hypothetical protein